MKINFGKRSLTFGEFVARVYDVCGKRKASSVVRVAVKAHVIEFRGQQRFEII